MKIKTLLASSLVVSVAAVAGMTATAQAQVAVPFNGTVGKSCVLDNAVAGSLVPDAPTLPKKLSSKINGGAAGSVVARCNTTANISATYAKTSGPALTVSAHSIGLSHTSVSEGDTTITVDLTLESATPITAGDYAYNVTVTATP
jgi:hypothetical protein